jgi:hypothetical protein
MPQPVIHRQHFKVVAEKVPTSWLGAIGYRLTRRRCQVALRFYQQCLPCTNCQVELVFDLQDELGKKSVDDDAPTGPDESWCISVQLKRPRSVAETLRFLDSAALQCVDECGPQCLDDAAAHTSEQPVPV